MHYTDEQLCQLIDGELSRDDEATLRAAMTADDSLAERFALLAMADAGYKASISAIDETPVPDSILSLLADDQAGEYDHRQPDNSRNAFTPWRRLVGAMVNPPAPYPYLAMAFSFLLFGILIILLWQPGGQTGELAAQDPKQAIRYGLINATNPVAEILSNAPSGSPQTIAGRADISVTPVLSFAGTIGDFCREYTFSDTAASHRAVACHQGQGWRVVLSTRTDKVLSSDQYQTASAITPSAFEERINQIIHGDPLSYQQELLLIERGWAAKKHSKN